jgi:hypothetical protein
MKTSSVSTNRMPDPKGTNEPHRPRAGDVITFSDEDETATIHTHERRIVTKLRNNPAAELIEDISFAERPAQSSSCLPI